MRNTQARRYARWSAAVAILLAATVAGVYVQRSWRSRKVRQEAPSVPPTVEEQSAHFTLSKVAGDQTQFTVRATRFTQFKEGNHSLLEDVWITAYGSARQRYDNLHTRSCDYIATTGMITCSGEVQIDLQSSKDAALQANASAVSPPDPRVVHIGTSRLSFEGQTGVATTDQPVEFTLPQGEGRAIGVRYESKAGELDLLHNVQMTLRPPAPSAAGLNAPAAGPAAALGGTDVNISGSSMIYRRDDRVVHLLGPVEVVQGSSKLHADTLDVELDDDLRARRIVADGHPELTGIQQGSPVSVTADEISTLLSADGWTQMVIATGNVHLKGENAAGENSLAADRVELETVTGTNQPRQMTATGNVSAQADLAQGASRHMTTSELVMEFAPGEAVGTSRLARATTPAAILDWQDPAPPSGKGGVQRMHLTGNHLDASFSAGNELHEVHGTGGVEMQRQTGDAAPVTSSSQEVVAEFAPGGEWASVDQTGNVRLRDAGKTAEAARAHFDHIAESATLGGSVVLTDETSRTTAQTGNFVQAANEFHADGGVVTSELSANTAPQSASGASAAPPAHISADHLVMNTITGHAVYSGRARLWQGDSVVEADRVEIDRMTQILTATGRVRAIFPQAPGALTPASSGTPVGTRAASAQPAPPTLVHAEAGRMVYASGEHRARLDQGDGAFARTDQGSIHSETMDLFFAPTDPKVAPAAVAPANSPLGAMGGQSLTRATALGSVVIDDSDRHAKGGRADYTAADGKFVLSGDKPTVYDASGNATTGRQLTFVFADDTIVVDSEEGSRTLTLHRVGK